MVYIGILVTIKNKQQQPIGKNTDNENDNSIWRIIGINDHLQ
ncbi:MAG: hypothetical protein ACI8VT_004136 [Saprospiraceae bacterium]|jgi:hypothetical protein